MIHIDNKKDCCGCSVCASVCPKGCITIKTDEEGFYYPEVIPDNCISCGLCDSKCPVINNKPEVPSNQSGYVVQHKDLEVLKDSTSGGAFTGFAEYIIKKGGVVVGAALNQDLLVEHIIVDNIDDLSKFRNSKYVQSYISPDIYKRVNGYLKGGVLVCFSGTGCQIEALSCYLGDKAYDNLFCIDVVCRAVPSPLAFKKYVEYQEARTGTEIQSLRFRDKYFGYKFSTVNIGFKGVSKHYHRGIESDPWHRAFFSGICNRPSCYECVFKKRYRVSDITIWDCFDYESSCPNMKRNLGATNILIHTSKGVELFEKVKDSFIVNHAIPDIQVAEMKEMTKPAKESQYRKAFLSDAQVLNGMALYRKYFPVGIKNNILYYGRYFSVKIGVYPFLKKLKRLV